MTKKKYTKRKGKKWKWKCSGENEVSANEGWMVLLPPCVGPYVGQGREDEDESMCTYTV